MGKKVRKFLRHCVEMPELYRMEHADSSRIGAESRGTMRASYPSPTAQQNGARSGNQWHFEGLQGDRLWGTRSWW